MKIHPRIQNTSQNSKTLPRIQNTSQNPKHVPESKTILDSGTCFVFWDMFLDSGMYFGLWDVFSFLGSVLDSGKCFVSMSHSRSGIYLWLLQWSFISLHPLRPCIWHPTALSHMSHTWCPQVPESPLMRPNVPVPFSPVPVSYTAINFLYTWM